MPNEPRPDRSFLRSAGVVSGLTLVSRILGLARDSATAHLLGGGAVNDALSYAWTIPNAFRRLFGEGALGSAFVPVFTRVLHRDGLARARDVANTLISTLLLFLLLLASGLAVLASTVPESWLTMVFGADNLEKARLTVDFTRLLLPYLALICVIAQFMAVMNAMKEFAIPAFSPVILNLVWLGGVGVAAWGVRPEAGMDPKPGQAMVIAGSILVAAVFQLAWHLPRLRTLGVSFRVVRPRLSPEVREVLRLMGPMLLGMGASQLSIIIDRTIALTALPDGGATHLYYGMRLMQFPLGLVSVALVTTVFPALTRLAVQDDRPGVLATASLALRTNLFMAATAGAGLVALALPIVRLLFQGGEFGPESSALTARALLGYGLGVPFAGTVMLLTRASYAVGDMRLPVRVGLIGVVVNLGLDLALVGPMRELGLSLATTIAAAVTATLLLFGLRRRLGLGRSDRLLAGSWRSATLAIVMGVGVFLIDSGLAPHVSAGRGGAAIRVVVGLASGLALVLLLGPRMCPAEWRELTPLRRRSPPGD